MSNNLKEGNSRFSKNVMFVVLSNALTLLSGFLAGFIIPKIMGVEDFGYYKTFTLYTSYVGIFHFGFVDGILFVHAGKNIDEIDKFHFKMLTKFMFIFEALISLLGVIIAISFLEGFLKIIFLLIAINLFALNCTTYFEYIVQITMNFKQLSLRGAIKAFLQVIIVIVFYVLYKLNVYSITPYVYILFIVAINYILLLWYIFTYSSFVFGKSNKFDFNLIKKYFRYGFPLMCSNLLIMLIFAVDQIFVNILFDKETYAYYAFSYSLISLITTTTNAISIVFFPTIKKMDDRKTMGFYEKYTSIILIFSSLCLCAFQCFEFIIYHFIPKYVNSISVLKIVVPIVILTTPITVIKFNFYKKYDMIKQYFVISATILFLSIVADLIVYILFKNIYSISIVSVVVCFIWNVWTELYFCLKNKQKFLINFLFLIIVLIIFYSVTLIENYYISLLVYFSLIVIMAIVLFYKSLFNKRGYNEK